MTGPQGYDALVVGAGVSGLTTAVVLAEAGLAVRVMTSDPPLRTVSAMAGASWGPFLAGHEAVPRWSAVSRAVFVQLAAEYGSGVHLSSGVEAYQNMDAAPRWATEVPDFRDCELGEYPTGYKGAWRYTIPLVDMPSYLSYLSQRLSYCGGGIDVIAPLTSLSVPLSVAPVVVNCTGLGARELLDDVDVVPCRGQLTVVENPGITDFFQDNIDGDDLTCIFPHGDKVVLGGTTETNVDAMTYDPNQERQILDRCARIDPRLAGARVVERRVGLRPQRSRIRVERDPNLDGLIHNYGHGGSGVTLSWGCAMDVLKLVRQR
ncbi:FAD-dependent oxidoreductase [Stackebrandtia nassauensis]|uniref:D-amino-acid oxidase n=1 Tax=Stackebrandtia nassauensis (strain DSM 44728 / CIP 108903 / NRRL B-16338 / NBRC 102104 / LLR-40K-21) TaxID=446470 RepID=D3QB61_STANL|nr:FAD-dependent oxidoreductase [Stackebrandtia nassauensis]ADD40878.1 D-aspartate oxidase [Stackebrandtia nassauensis DSM 44728]